MHVHVYDINSNHLILQVYLLPDMIYHVKKSNFPGNNIIFS